MAASVRGAIVEVLRPERQVQAVNAACGGRPAVSVVADVVQHSQLSIARVAEARGGVPGERGSRARGAYLVETTVGGFVVPGTIFFAGYAVRIVRESPVEWLVCVFRARKVRPSPVRALAIARLGRVRQRAGGNLIQTRATRLNDSLLQQSRAVELCPGWNCRFLVRKLS